MMKIPKLFLKRSDKTPNQQLPNLHQVNQRPLQLLPVA